MSTATALPERLTTLMLDLDGTLVDTTYFHTVAWFLAFDEVGARQPMWTIHPLIGMGGDELVTELLGHPSERVADAHDRRFAEYLPSIRALPGARDLVELGAATGLTVCIVTSSKEEVLDGMLAPIGGPESVDHVVHSGMVDHTKPHPDLFHAALAQSGAEPSQVLAVGDAVWDVAAAGAAGIACIGLESGGSSRQSLSEAGAVDVFVDARELVEDLGSEKGGRRPASA